MNNSWGQYPGDQYAYQMPGNMMTMPPMMQSMQQPPPLLPPPFMMDMHPPTPASVAPGLPLIGPVKPDGPEIAIDTIMIDDFDQTDGEKNPQNEKSQKGGGGSRDNKGDGRRERERDRPRQQRSRERYDRNDRGDRNDRDKSDRMDRNDNRGRRERRSKWDNDKNNQGFPGQVADAIGNIMMPGMIPYGNMMAQQQMDMGNMSAMANVPGMQPMMPGMNMMPNMMGNMMGNMMDHNMMMMNQQLMPLIPNQPFYVSNATLLPPVPGTAMPNRRERPQGCRTVFVGGLPNGIGEDVIQEIFQRFGCISDIKLHRQGVCHVRFENQEGVERSFMLSGYRFKLNNQSDNEATTLFIDFALNREDQNEYERSRRNREPTPPRVEPFSPAALATVTEKIKSDDQFAEGAPTLAMWLERGECNKKNASTFYSLIQASNNQIRRLFSEKMALDEEYQAIKTTMREKFAIVVMQFEQVAKILTAAKHQRVSDHFNKQQRKNIEMWLKMTEEVQNIKEEFNACFDEEDIEKIGKNMVSAEKYEELKTANENLMYELEGYKNEAYLAQNEAERKFEKFKAHYVAQQALQTGKQVFPPLPPPPMPSMTLNPPLPSAKPQPPTATSDDDKFITSGPAVPPSEAKLISILTAFLLVHPLGASLDYLVSYVRSMVPNVTQATVNQVLHKHTDVFYRETTGIGASIENKWTFVTFDVIKKEG